MKQTGENHIDIFGPSVAYNTRNCLSRNRPSMISAKYKQKEERRKVLKTSINKLKKIDDPEASLCRSVLINNTMKKLQDDARNEKLQKHQPSHDKDKYLSSEILKKDEKITSNSSEAQFSSEDFLTQDSPEKVSDSSLDNKELLDIVEENLNCSVNSDNLTKSVNPCPETAESRSKITSRKRSFSDLDDCNVQDVLSQFCIASTPTMLTCIDDYEDVKIAIESPKRCKVDSEEQPSESKISSYIDSTLSDFGVNTTSLNNNGSTKVSRLRHFGQSDTDSNSLSCGQESMFGEFRNNSYQNLIASLES